MAYRILMLLTVLSLLGFGSNRILGADVNLDADLKAMQGKWRGTLNADGQTSTWLLTIREHKSQVNVQNSEGETVFKGESEFKLEQFGPFRAFTFFNLEIQSGDRAGDKILTGGETRSSVYKLEEDAFTTAGGFDVKDERGKPHLIRWQRVNP